MEMVCLLIIVSILDESDMWKSCSSTHSFTLYISLLPNESAYSLYDRVIDCFLLSLSQNQHTQTNLQGGRTGEYRSRWIIRGSRLSVRKEPNSLYEAKVHGQESLG